MPADTIFTIGHSTHAAERFLELLSAHRITAIGDVRSQPYSRVNPQFNREAIQATLRSAGIAYVFLGAELGARTEDPACYIGGKVQYNRLAQTDAFRRGLSRIREGMQDYRIALMCAEREPLECHRTLLVARRLAALDIPVQHILADGGIESHEQAAERLVRQLGLPEQDLFRSRGQVIEDAWKLQEARFAYVRA